MNFTPKNIKDFLYTPGRYFLIPEFQRPYSWGIDNINSLLADLETLLGNKKSHYFGSIVYVSDPSDPNAEALIDGQQRATTTLLLLMSIYHIALESPEKCSYPAKQLEHEYLINSAEWIDEKKRVKLKAVTTDDRIFAKLYEKAELTPDEKQSRLYLAYREFHKYFSGKDHLEDYVNALERFQIMTVKLDPTEDDPQRVFESINSTGKPLTDGDKIRNYALMLNSAEDRRYIIDNYWKQIEKPLTGIDKDYITDFFRTYMIAKRDTLIPLGNVYPEFKQLFKDNIAESQPREDLERFYGDILKHLDYYRLFKFGDDIHDRFGAFRSFFFRMRYIQIETFAPFALSVLDDFVESRVDEAEAKRLFELAETYYARRIICNIPSTSIDKLFATMHRDILDHRKTSPESSYSDIMSFILLSKGGNTRLPRDSEIDLAVANNPTYLQRKTHVNYLMASVDRESKESAVLKQIANKDLRLSIEHIMPQTLTKQWNEDLGADSQRIHETYLHTLANLTLTGYNSEYSNRSYAEKKSMTNGFDDSSLSVNLPLHSVDHWDEQALLARRAWWQQKLESSWPEPTTSYKPVEVDTKVSLLDDHDLTGTSVRILHMQGDTIPVSTWSETLDAVVERMFELDPDFYDKIVTDELAARYIRADQESLRGPEQINDTEYFVEMHTNTATKKQLMERLCRLMGWEREELMVELAEPLASE